MFPFIAGRPADAHHRRQGGRLRARRCSRSTRRYAHQVIANARALAEAWPPRACARSSGGTDTHLALLDLRDTRRDRRGGRGALRRRRDHAQQERDPVRPAAADGRLRHPGRHPAVTTQGMGESEMKEIAALIGRAVRDPARRRRHRCTAEVAAAGVRELVGAPPCVSGRS